MVAGSRHSGESTFKFASPVNGKKKPVKFSALSTRENSMGLGLTAETDKNGYCCSNALYGASYEKWLEIAQQVCQTANEDILANNAYWQQFESPVSKAADSAYSGFLQSYDQELGSKSYGAVVDLLVAYYGGV